MPSSNPAASEDVAAATRRPAGRGQASIEILAIVTIFTVIFFVMAGIYQNEFSATSRRVQILALRQVADDVSLSVNSVVLEGDGYSANLTLPYKVGAANYSVSVADGIVTVALDNGLSLASRIMAKNVTGAFVNGQNRITNAGGRIYVE